MFDIKRKKSGFTLIELLVVIAIIAILAAILFPVFARAREAARKSSCQSNLKELATAVQMYHQDYDGMLPSSYLLSATTSPEYRANFCGRRGTMPVPQAGVSGVDITWPTLLWPHMKNKDIVWCPSDSDKDETTGPSNRMVSYIWKPALDKAWWGDGTIFWRKEGDFEFVADQMLMFEKRGWHWGDQSKGFQDGVTLNACFLDGHVRAVRLMNTMSGPVKLSGDVSKTSQLVTSIDIAGEPFYFNFNSQSGAVPAKAAFDPGLYYDKLP